MFDINGELFILITRPIIPIIGMVTLILGNNLYFYYLGIICLIYTTIELLWMILKPEDHKEPKIMSFHHVLTLLLLFIPIYEYKHLEFISLLLLVEWSSVFMKIRKYCYKFHKKYFNLSDILFKIVWVIFRNVYFPILFLVMILNIIIGLDDFTSSYKYMIILSQLGLVILNFHWSGKIFLR